MGHIHLFADDAGDHHFEMMADFQEYQDQEFSADIYLGVHYHDDWYPGYYWAADFGDSSDDVAYFLAYVDYYDDSTEYVHLHVSQWLESGNMHNTFEILENTTEQEFDGDIEIMVEYY